MSDAVCRGCGAPIRWVVMRSGRSMPCDPELLSEWVGATEHRRPNVTLVDPTGILLTGHRAWVLDPDAREIRGYVPHWRTCARAAEFRR